MCNVCCRALKNWCKSFTKTEIGLLILLLVLFIVFVCVLVFVILHFLACEDPVTYDASEQSVNLSFTNKTTTTSAFTTRAYKTTTEIVTSIITETTTYKKTTFNKTLECSWRPSFKTERQTRYFIITSMSYKPNTEIEQIFQNEAPFYEYFDDDGSGVTYQMNQVHTREEDFGDILQPDSISELNGTTLLDYGELPGEIDGEEIDEKELNVVLALVKLKPPGEMTFGCILTIITMHWTLTAASCIEAIEEMAYLEEFVMMEDYGSVKKGRTHSVSDLQIHPLYEGVNRSYDLAALKTESNLLKRSKAVGLASLLDYLMITIGEKFHVLGYGLFRSIDTGPEGHRLRRAPVYGLPSEQCVQEGGPALRRLGPGSAPARAGCGAAAICAGAVRARGPACRHCAGAPLLASPPAPPVLLGLMSEGGQCGLACDPQLYVNVAALGDWIRATVHN